MNALAGEVVLGTSLTKRTEIQAAYEGAVVPVPHEGVVVEAVLWLDRAFEMALSKVYADQSPHCTHDVLVLSCTEEGTMEDSQHHHHHHCWYRYFPMDE